MKNLFEILFGKTNKKEDCTLYIITRNYDTGELSVYRIGNGPKKVYFGKEEDIKLFRYYQEKKKYI